MKKILAKILTIQSFLVFFLSIELVLLGVIFVQPYFALYKDSIRINSDEFGVPDLESWVSSFEFYKESKSLPTEDASNSRLFSALESYKSMDKTRYPYLELPEIKFELSEEIEVEVDPPVSIVEEERFPQGERFLLQKGESSSYKLRNLTIGSNEYISPITTPVFEEEQILAVGSANRVDLKATLKEELQNIQKENKEGDWYRAFNDKESENLKKMEVVEVSFDASEGEGVIAGKVEMINKSCSDKINIELYFDPETKKYYFTKLENVVLKDCTVRTTVQYAPVVYSPAVVVSCTDCKYAPIDKTTALSSGYVPPLAATGLPGGGMLTPETVTALKRMSDDIINKGMTVYVTSAYRSYSQQQSTFNHWVNTELAKGSSPEIARQRANIYSAFPGHSEHQLGTTLDVRCSDCAAFSKDVNLPLYKYLQQHAHEYGFVISYPQSKQHLTGYTYEPWHIRYIGVDLASELQSRGYQNPGNNVYLSAFLREKGLY